VKADRRRVQEYKREKGVDTGTSEEERSDCGKAEGDDGKGIAECLKLLDDSRQKGAFARAQSRVAGSGRANRAQMRRGGSVDQTR
jgi:hypothetical protein